jgi:hypothetical protein
MAWKTGHNVIDSGGSLVDAGCYVYGVPVAATSSAACGFVAKWE